jgi:transposase InsO family protein
MLRREAIQGGKNRIRRLMDEQGLQPVQKRRFRPQTTQSRHDQPIAPNRLKELPEPPKESNEVWMGDTTYLPTLDEAGFIWPPNWTFVPSALSVGNSTTPFEAPLVSSRPSSEPCEPVSSSTASFRSWHPIRGARPPKTAQNLRRSAQHEPQGLLLTRQWRVDRGDRYHNSCGKSDDADGRSIC